MSKLLYIQASPRVDRSKSRAVADAFVEEYKKNNPDDKVEVVDVFKEDLPAFDGLAVQAKYSIMHGEKHTSEEKEAWSVVEKVIEKFKAADKYVMAVPMWNFGIPYRLKQYFDLIVQPGYTFSSSPEGVPSGLVTGKPILVTYARGGEYPEGSEGAALDFQKKYMDLILGYIGFTDVKSIVVEPTLMGGPDVATHKKGEAIVEAKQLAKEF